MNAIINGKILLPDRMVEGHALLYTNKIVGVVPTDHIPADTVCIDARGGFSNTYRAMVYFVVNRFQVTKMKDIVHEIDPHAYITISEVADVFSRNMDNT